MKKFHLAFCEEWRLVSQVRINERCTRTYTRTNRGETSDSLYPILSCRSFHAWDYTRWYKKSGSSRRSWCLDILNFMTCNNTIEPVDHSPSFLLYEKKSPFLFAHSVLTSSSFLFFFFLPSSFLRSINLLKKKVTNQSYFWAIIY